MASAGGVLGRCCGSGLGSAGAPSSQGLWGRPRSTGASGCRRRMRGPRCWGRARASVPAPWRARGVDDQETALGHAAGRAGMPCPRWGLRQSSGAPLSSLRSSATPKARMRQVRSHNVTGDSGSPEGLLTTVKPPALRGRYDYPSWLFRSKRGEHASSVLPKGRRVPEEHKDAVRGTRTAGWSDARARQRLGSDDASQLDHGLCGASWHALTPSPLCQGAQWPGAHA